MNWYFRISRDSVTSINQLLINQFVNIKAWDEVAVYIRQFIMCKKDNNRKE